MERQREGRRPHRGGPARWRSHERRREPRREVGLDAAFRRERGHVEVVSMLLAKQGVDVRP